MKKAAVKLLLFLFCLSMAFLSYQAEAATPAEISSPVKQEASTGKWEFYASDEEGTDYSYNPDALKHLKGSRVKVSVRAVYSEKNPKYRQAESQWEMDCSKKSMRGLTAHAQKKDGTEEIIKKSSDWSAIPSESTAETLYETVCKKKGNSNP